MLIAHKIALDPNNVQSTYCAKAAGTARFAYNWVLEQWQKQYEAWKPASGLPKPSQYSLRHLVKPDNSGLVPQSVDRIFLCVVLHHIDNRIEYLRKLSAALKPEGRVVLIDFKPNSPVGPPPAHRILEDEAKAKFREAGYRLVKEHDVLPYQYFLEFVP